MTSVTRVPGAITLMSLLIAPHASAQTDQPLTSSALASVAEIAEEPQSEKPEQPAHTGFGAIVRGTVSDFAAFPRRQSTWVILAIGGAVAAAAHPIDDNVNARLQGSDAAEWFFAAGKVIGNGWVLGGAAVGTYMIGRYAMAPTEGKTNKVSHTGADLIRAELVAAALTYGIKVSVQRDRPTGECCSFPSGHASGTFAAASVLERHFGYRNAWPTLVIASYVAASRLHDNRHFLSDVLFGSALGMASGWTVVGRHGRESFTVLPAPIRGGVMVTVTRVRSGDTSPRPKVTTTNLTVVSGR